MIHALAPKVGQGMTSPLLGGPVLNRELLLRVHKDRKLLQRLALAFVRRILDVWPSEKADRHVAEIFNSKGLDTVGFHNKLAELCKSKGREFEFRTPIASAADKFIEAFQPGSEYNRATCTALGAVFSSLAPTERVVDGIDLEQSPPLQLSAFLEIIDFDNVVISDMWAWAKPYDSEAVREVLRALVKISAVDEPVLAVEAKAMLSRMDELPEADPLHVLLPTVSVDVPPPEWSVVKALQIDRTKLEQALSHESVWFIRAATNLLYSLGGTTVEKAEELLANGHGYGLAAAAHLTLELKPAVATELLLDRIEGPDTPGKHYLIRELNQLDPPWDKRLAAVIRTGLMSSATELAEEAATLIVKYVESGAPVPPELLNEAFQHWITLEKACPQEERVIQNTPRETLLKGMLKLETIDDERLMNLCRDAHWDVRKTATGALLERITIPDAARMSFVNEIVAKVLPVSLLSQALVTKVPFSEIEVDQLRVLLEDQDPKWRLASSKLLDPIYLESDVIRQIVEKLLVDPHPEVRQAAQALDHAQTLPR